MQRNQSLGTSERGSRPSRDASTPRIMICNRDRH